MFVVFFLIVRRCCLSRVRNVWPVSPMYNLWHDVHVMAYTTFEVSGFRMVVGAERCECMFVMKSWDVKCTDSLVGGGGGLRLNVDLIMRSLRFLFFLYADMSLKSWKRGVFCCRVVKCFLNCLWSCCVEVE